MTTAPHDGGAPMLGQGLALDLMNTFHTVRGKPADGIGSPATATAWLQQIADRLAHAGVLAANEAQLSASDLPRLLRLRQASRGIASVLVEQGVPDQEDLEYLNHLAALSPAWNSMAWHPQGGGTSMKRATGTPADQVLGTFASDAIDLFTGVNAARLRLCEAPGCILFFLKDHARREWCTPACGARVRAARAYQKRVGSQRVATAR